MNLLNISEIIVLSSLIGTVIVLMILIIKTMFRNKLSPTFHYYIWLILLVKLIIPLGPQTPLNVSTIYENLYVQTTTNENTPITQINSSKQLENTDGSTSIASQTSKKSSIMSAITLPLKSKPNIKSLFCFIWSFGIVLSIGVLFAGHRKLQKIIRASIKNVTSIHKEILYKCMKNMNIKNKVELSYSSKISSPSLCGFIKPKILIPINVAEHVSDEEFKYIIMHELTHLKNNDIFINWIITLLSMIYWFNPILLYGFHKTRQDCEFSCDDQAISYLAEGENLQYGNAIIRVLELGGKYTRLMGTTSMVMKSSEIKRRIIMISKYKKVNIKNIILGTIIVVIIGGLGIVLNTSKSHVKTSATIAEEFGKNLYTVDAQKVTDYKKMLKERDLMALPNAVISKTGGVVEVPPTPDYIKVTQSLDKYIQPIMTQNGYDILVASRFNYLSADICNTSNYTLQVTDFILDKNLYGEKENKAGYYYEAKLKFISKDGKSERTDTTKGYIGLLKENGQWKVSIYKLTLVPKLYTEIMTKQ